MQPLFSANHQRKIAWLYTIATLIVLLLGWYYPFLGYMVALAMLGGMISALIAGRWFCGNMCPRGGLLGMLAEKYSPRRAVPAWLISTKVRIGAVIFLFAMMGYNVFGRGDYTDWQHWGRVFWLMCLVTTVIGAVLAFFWHGRSWCQICPMGSMQNLCGGGISPLQLDASKCKQCLLCEKVCPLHLSIIEKGATPKIKMNRDCLKCGQCIAACPIKCLSME